LNRAVDPTSDSTVTDPADTVARMTGSPSAALKQELIEIGRDFHRRGWSLGTSSNYSAVVSKDPLRLLITGSGFDKGRLTPDQFVVVDGQGARTEPTHPKPSAETLLHTLLARKAGAGAVLHTHSVWGTLLSEALQHSGRLRISGYEMLKGLSGVTTHEACVSIAVVPNTQDIAALAESLEGRLAAGDPDLRHGFLMAGHGLYTWGADLAEARRHIEVLEFLMEVLGTRRSIPV
jgi:methylthioribulose-1-phosphate dehydratase